MTIPIRGSGALGTALAVMMSVTALSFLEDHCCRLSLPRFAGILGAIMAASKIAFDCVGNTAAARWSKSAVPGRVRFPDLDRNDLEAYRAMRDQNGVRVRALVGRIAP